MSGTKPDPPTEAIRDPDIIEACKATIEDLDPVQLDDADNAKKAYIGHNLSEPDVYTQILSTPYHPNANGQAESFNKVILNILKKKLKEAKGLWPKRLPEVLWAYRTMPNPSTGENPYSLVYGTDAVIPVEVGEPILIYSNISGADNDESRLQDLDEVEERRDMAHVRMVAQKQQVERYYNKKANVRSLKVSDYVLKAKTLASKDPNEGKFGTNWDEPYKIIAVAEKGAFQLETMEGKLLQNNWNIAHLKYFHF
ncbi:uncharacterized protein LOC142176391 [Nicotiana tabacum]|uniref:Uncharacterized protein LOC142176391 n=1 Tax=Nicotiana tabacum TaxID=4097 RepID=A0AC58TS26_TOBAC